MAEPKEIKKFNVIIQKTFIYPLQVEALTKKQATEIAKQYKTKKEKWILDETEYIHEDKYRTTKQSNAVHLICSQWAKALTEDGITTAEVLEHFKTFDTFPTMEILKELWKKIQFKLFKTKSTKQLKKDGQIDLIYDPINKIFSENYGIHIPFPEQRLLDYDKMAQEHENSNRI